MNTSGPLLKILAIVAVISSSNTILFAQPDGWQPGPYSVGNDLKKSKNNYPLRLILKIIENSSFSNGSLHAEEIPVNSLTIDRDGEKLIEKVAKITLKVAGEEKVFWFYEPKSGDLYLDDIDDMRVSLTTSEGTTHYASFFQPTLLSWHEDTATSKMAELQVTSSRENKLLIEFDEEKKKIIGCVVMIQGYKHIAVDGKLYLGNQSRLEKAFATFERIAGRLSYEPDPFDRGGQGQDIAPSSQSNRFFTQDYYRQSNSTLR